MKLDDLFQHLWRAGVIPYGVGVNDRDRATQAHAQTVHFAAIDERLGAGQFEFSKTGLQKLPGGKSLVAWSSLRFGLIGTEKDVTPIFLKPKGLNAFGKIRVHC